MSPVRHPVILNPVFVLNYQLEEGRLYKITCIRPACIRIVAVATRIRIESNNLVYTANSYMYSI